MVSKTSHKKWILFTLVLALVCCQQDSIDIHAQEQKITQAIKMQFDNFKIYPFALTKQQDYSIFLSFHQTQTVKAQIRLNCISPEHSKLLFPTYNPREYVIAQIQDMRTKQVHLQRRFYFQTGLTFTAQKDHRYQIRFIDIGSKNKMLEMAISNHEPFRFKQIANTNLINSTDKVILMSKQLQDQFNSLALQSQRSEMRVKNALNQLSVNLDSYLMGSVWQIVVVGAMMGFQILVFRRLLKRNQDFV